ncbi:MAG: deoxyribodipyrimidine photo-lyase, partial [Gammaproteobacteria bacterium]|nr:deoxyribodipyrimidine photo-lyase [Gammaproteobacteria bacterium]
MAEIINIHWFRRDLRLEDNAALYHALCTGSVMPIFIFDTNILDRLDDKRDRRLSFIYEEISALKKTIEKKGSTLRVFHGRPIDVFNQLIHDYQVGSVFAGRDYEPYAVQRDTEIASLLSQHNSALQLHKDHVIYESHEILKLDGSPYIIYTPYMKAWKKKYLQDPCPVYESEKLLDALLKQKPAVLPELDKLGFIRVPHSVPEPMLDPVSLRQYDSLRDYPARDATSRIGPHLRFGTLGIRKLVA